jgi:peptidoglycan/xylan/chitin deacetylase (PgdA/CDA1 family)
MREVGGRVFWVVLALLHRLGLFGAFSYAANRFTRAGGGPLPRRRRVGTVQILTYHRIAREPDSFLPPMPLATFARQMECLARRFHVMDLTEAIEAIARSSVPDNAVVITFDDGYRDNFELAFPVLAAHSLPATVFLTTGVIGTRASLWHDRVFDLFHRTRVRSLTDSALVDGPARLDDLAARQAALYGLLPRLRSLDPERREGTLRLLAARLEVEERTLASRLMLDWDEVRAMHRGGVSFGAHTVTHTVLSSLPPERARWEIVESKREIERQIAAPVTLFAYPNGRSGDFGPAAKEVLRGEGFRGAVTTIFGSNPGPRGEWDPFEIRRGGPDACEPPLFQAKMNVLRFAS